MASSVTAVNTSTAWGGVLQGVAAKEHRDQLRADLKLRLDGGNSIGPARQPKSAEDRKKGGKPQDGLVDDFVFEFDERIVGFCFSGYYHYTSAGIVVITAKTKSNTHARRSKG